MAKYILIPLLIIALGSYMVIWFDGKEGWVPFVQRKRQRLLKRYGVYLVGIGIVSLLTTIAILWSQY